MEIQKKQEKPDQSETLRRAVWLLVAIGGMAAVLALDISPSLSPLGQAMLAVLIFSVTIWVSGAVGFAESSLYVIVVMALLAAFTPDPAKAGSLLGSRQGLLMALSGFDSDAWAQVTAAFFIASAAKLTGLGDRLGLWVMSLVGTGPYRMLAGVLAMCYVMELFIPSPTGVVVLVVALLQKVMEVNGIRRGSNLAKGMMLAVAFGTATASIGILTSNAPAIQTANLIAEATGREISWLRWFLYGEPFGIALGLVLYGLILLLFPPGRDYIPSRPESMKRQLSAMGPMSGPEKRLLTVLSAAILLWASSGLLHPLNNSTVAIMAAAAIFLPGMGIGDWREVSRQVDWGVLMLYGTSVSMGQWLLKSGAASWVANNTLVAMGLHQLPPVVSITLLVAVFSIFALFFSARAAAVAALVPTAIGFAASFPGGPANLAGISLISFYTLQTAAILPMHHPMAMVTYATGNFTSREMGLVGVFMILFQIVLTALFISTYWRLTGLLGF
ncbi:MAG: SLC13 family permease [Desulfocucumaceae bacterium]